MYRYLLRYRRAGIFVRTAKAGGENDDNERMGMDADRCRADIVCVGDGVCSSAILNIWRKSYGKRNLESYYYG